MFFKHAFVAERLTIDAVLNETFTIEALLEVRVVCLVVVKIPVVLKIFPVIIPCESKYDNEAFIVSI